VFSCIASLALGGKSVRGWLSHNRFFTSDFLADHPRFLLWISIIGSLFINTGATVLTADILAASNAGATAPPPLITMYLLWVSRPLATALTTWLSIADRKAYQDNAREVAISDSLYSLVNIYLFGSVAQITNARPSDVPAPARLARAGSALWLLALALSLGFLLWYLVEHLRGKASSRALSDDGGGGTIRRSLAPHLPWIWFLLDGIRFVACWLLWAGFLFGDETAFCPSQGAVARVTVTWLFVPFIDCLWRGFATSREEENGVEVENLIDT
jgi:hypothetical protein